MTDTIRIEEGCMDDYLALAQYHYRSPRPATGVLTLVARDTHDETLAGVLVVSMPTINARWREIAWPRRFGSGSNRQRVRQLNRELRTISRVVVHPRWRALGIAKRLVLHYLAHRLTPCTEAVAAMGRFCPFFERAGMRAIEAPESRRTARLLSTLADVKLDPLELIEAGRAGSALMGSPALRHAIRRWAVDSRATRHLLDDLPEEGAHAAGSVVEHPLTEVAIMAASSLVSRPMVYVHS